MTGNYGQVELLVRQMARRPQMSLGLERTEALLRALDGPQNAYGGALVAGTNGKGSTCAMLRAVLTACGRRVGGNPSPPLVDIRDRFLIGDDPVDADVLGEAALRTQRAMQTLRVQCTEFEILTAMAFEAFRIAGCDAVIAEVGLGGRYDSTNTYRPHTKVISGIDFDHTEVLGPDLHSIAVEKSGIIHPGDVVVVAPLPAEAEAAVRERVSSTSAHIRPVANHVAARTVRQDWGGQDIFVEDEHLGSFTVRLPVLGRHQSTNLATALCALAPIRDDLGVDMRREVVLDALGRLNFPGRLQVVQWRRAGVPRAVVDVAHNTQAIRAVVDTVRSLHDGPVVMLFGCYADKDVEGMLACVPREWRCVFTTAPSPRGLPAERVAEAAKAAGLSVDFAAHSVPRCLEAAMRLDERSAVVLALGSFSVAGAVRELLCSTAAQDGKERDDRTRDDDKAREAGCDGGGGV